MENLNFLLKPVLQPLEKTPMPKAIIIACTFLLFKILFLSVLTVAVKKTKDQKTDFYKNGLLRIKNTQRNDMENSFMMVLLIWMNTGFSNNFHQIWLVFLVGIRYLHTFFYLSSMQPYRGYSWFIGYFMSLYMCYDMYKTENVFQKISALLILKTLAMSLLTGLKRFSENSPHAGIEEDKMFFDKQKLKESKNRNKKTEGTERMLLAHSKDLYNHIPVLIIAILTLNNKILAATEIAKILQFYLIARTAHTFSGFLGLPTIINFITYFIGVYFSILLLIPWNFHTQRFKNFKKSNATHLILFLMIKCLFIGILEQFYNIKRGIFDVTKSQLIEPKKHEKDENIKTLNIQRNDAENVFVFTLLCLIIGLTKFDVSIIFVYFVARYMHSSIMVLEMPIPLRGLAWITNLVITFYFVYSKFSHAMYLVSIAIPTMLYFIFMY